MAEAKVTINRPNSANTPPNCAICLGSCTNKCFSDSCMHQFCFQCLLEWSRIKAECPLCKQPFKSILHNVKSNEEYDEHVVEAPRNEDVRLIGNEDMWFLPIPFPPHRHEFHVRTTFTVDSRGEHAIQQMLLAHPLTAGGRITVNTGVPSTRTLHPSRHRRDYSATSFRRSIYSQNLWAIALPDLTGRYRECSPTFFRNNPTARQRLVPWLNRELNALLYENTQLIMHLVDMIMDHLLRHHICSRTFRNLLQEYMDNKTEQFVHEFYSFMRSPYDMIGYDRSVIYTSRPQAMAPLLEDDPVEIPDDNSDDSDVVLVGETNPAEPVTIDLVESNSDSDEPIMVSSGSQVPMPLPAPVPGTSTPEPVAVRSSSPVNLVNLPPKLRYKHLGLEEKEKHRWMKKKQRRRSRSSSSSSSGSSSERTKREKESYRKYKKRKLKKMKQKKHHHNDSPNSSSEVNITSESDTDDNKPLIDIIKDVKHKPKRLKKDKKRRLSRHEDLPTVREPPRVENNTQLFPIDLSTPSSPRFPSSSTSLPNNSNRYHIELPKTNSTVELSDNGQYTVKIETLGGNGNYEALPARTTRITLVRNGLQSPQHSRERAHEDSASSGSTTEPYRIPSVKSEIREVKFENNPGPSTSKPTPLVLRRREHNKWYVFGDSDSSD